MRSRISFAMIVLMIIHAGSLPITDSEEISGMPTRAGIVTFTNVSEEVGLSDIRGNFFSWGDYDNDGDQDLLIDGRILMANTGPPSYQFIDQTRQAGIGSSSNSGVFGDFDNDGFLDIFCGGGKGSSDHPQHPDILWHNQRDGTFSKVTGEGNVPQDTFPTVASAWSDMDRDGFVDIYMANYEDASLQGYPDHLWMNNGDGTFTNATDTSGVSEFDRSYPGRGVSFCDFDNDGFQDAYVSNYRIMPNYLYRNQGNGTFIEIASESGVEGHGNVHPVTREGPYYGHSLGCSWGDLDNDGYMDLWVTNLAHKDVYRGPICDDSYLFRNLGPDHDFSFEDVRSSSGIEIKPLAGTITEGDELMVSSALADYDNDGYLDLFIPQIYNDIEYAHSLLYRNQGDMKFKEAGLEAGIRIWNTYGSAWCDYNNDGWMDLVTGGGVWSDADGSVQGRMVHLFRNNGAVDLPANNWLEIDLHGRESNTAAIGARVTVMIDRNEDGTIEESMMRDVQGGSAAHGQQDSMVLHFGLGPGVEEVDIKVEWPLGRKTFMNNVIAGKRIVIFEPSDPIDLTMEIISVEDNGGDAKVDLEIGNPSGHDIDVGWIEFDLINEGWTGFESVEFGDVPSGSSYRISHTFSDIPFHGLDIVEARLERTFPPLSVPLNRTFRLSQMKVEIPIAILDIQSSALVGQEVMMDGGSSYVPNGTIQQYSFDFGDGTGTGWTYSSVVSHSYSSPGNFTVSLRVMGPDGRICEEPAYETILITEEANIPPVARIIDIQPEIGRQGEMIEFKGEGIPSGDRSIREYEWSSSLDGILSRRPSFNDDDLSIGFHRIDLIVKDSEGLWSEPDSREIRITGDDMESPWVTMEKPEISGPFSVPVMLRGRAGPEGHVDRVEVRVDSGPWSEARGTVKWEFLLDTGDLSSDRQHVVQARALANGQYSDIESLIFNVSSSAGDTDQDTYRPSAGMEKDRDILAWIIIALVVMTILAMILLISRKRRSGPLFPERVTAIELE